MLTQSDIRTRLDSLIRTIRQIEAEDWIPFTSLKPSDLKPCDGVYVIADENEVLYVGQTTDIQRRIYTNHLMGNASTARLKKYLWEDKARDDIKSMSDAKKYLRDHCRFRWIRCDDARQRGLIEGGLQYAFNARYVDSVREGDRTRTGT